MVHSMMMHSTMTAATKRAMNVTTTMHDNEARTKTNYSTTTTTTTTMMTAFTAMMHKDNSPSMTNDSTMDAPMMMTMNAAPTMPNN